MTRFAAWTVLGCVTLAGSLISTNAAFGQSWPTKPIRIIVNFPPGGAADQLARLMAPSLTDTLGQPITVENRGGANGNIGSEAVIRSPADGYTLLMSSGGAVIINPTLFPKMSFDPMRDLVPVAAAARISVFLVIRASLPIKTVAEFTAYARANPGKLTYGSPGNGSSPHIAAEMFAERANVQYIHIPYRGAAPAMTDMLADRLDFAFDVGIGFPHVRSGRLRMLAVGSPHRTSAFPDVPTLAETGMPGFDADSIFGIYAPSGTPPEIVERLNRDIARALEVPATRERIAAIGGAPLALKPAEFAARNRNDRDAFAKIIAHARIKAD